MITRWKQHNECFRNGSKLSPMWLIELAEFCYINALQPKYNLAGKTSQRIFLLVIGK